MSNPQQPELARSRKTPHQDQDAVAAVVEGGRPSETTGPRGPVPPENQPGHHPAEEQDKPDLDAFAQRLGVATDDSTDDAATDRDADRPTDESSWAPPVEKATAGRAAAIAGALVAFLSLLIAGKRRRSRRR